MSVLDDAVAKAKQLFFEKGPTVRIPEAEGVTGTYHYGIVEAAEEVVKEADPATLASMCLEVLLHHGDLLDDGHWFSIADTYTGSLRSLFEAIIRQLAHEDPKVPAEMERLDGLDEEKREAEAAPS